jgi:hypothetical protein
MLLRTIAHSRTGDKGNHICVSLIAYAVEDYPCLVRAVTAERVAEQFRPLIVDPVIRYEAPNLQALNFVLRRPSEESVTRSLASDPHGKSLSSLLLCMEISLHMLPQLSLVLLA